MSGEILPDRFSEVEIYERVVAEAAHEMTKSYRRLLFSGIAGGFSITLTFIMYASLYSATDGAAVISALLYPIGFVYIIVGHYQLFTENTLPPVTLVLERISSIPAMLGIWGLVLAGNLIGALIGAVVLAYSGIFSPAVAESAASIGMKGFQEGWWDLFFKSAVTGLIVAGVVWMDFSVENDMARVALIYMAFLSIPVAGLYHIVVSTTEIIFLFLTADVSLFAGLLEFALPVLLGNIVGGVLLVTVVNYYQTPEGLKSVSGTLSIRDVLFTYNRTDVSEDDILENIEEGREG